MYKFIRQAIKVHESTEKATLEVGFSGTSSMNPISTPLTVQNYFVAMPMHMGTMHISFSIKLVFFMILELFVHFPSNSIFE